MHINGMRNLGLGLFFIVTFVISSCSNSQTTGVSQSEAEVKGYKIDFENAFIVDVRTPAEFAAGHFEGAVNIPLNTIENALNLFENQEQIIVYCRSGARSGNAKKILEKAGHTGVINGINQSNLESLRNK